MIENLEADLNGSPIDASNPDDVTVTELANIDLGFYFIEVNFSSHVKLISIVKYFKAIKKHKIQIY